MAGLRFFLRHALIGSRSRVARLGASVLVVASSACAAATPDGPASSQPEVAQDASEAEFGDVAANKPYSLSDVEADSWGSAPPTTLRAPPARPDVPSMTVLGAKKGPRDICSFDNCDLSDD
jgi:hypothetical protein